MKVIHPANEDILKVWGESKTASATYRLLTYAIPMEVENGTLMCNTVTWEMIFLNAEEMKNLSGLPCGYAPWMNELIKKHFLVREEQDDQKTVDTLRTVLTMFNCEKEIRNYTILPTMNCNARCFYCFEAGMTHDNMTDETADRTAEFIANHCGGKTVSIR